ncbi:MAG: adenosylcobinamide kinase / adenosylcobinamide-phosphate guanylyltransferase [Actinomycetota bacterium]|jgi:adenosyl cobinamide kinase/adenosyl cobinamide phosphate guanylyltransferase|nr:bifunctional adenosylcobinamide kinase/adenosylcobinamide-phosphate guanylyltransferase [Cryptosporangiaceae bacterium]MDQ1676989.1 adenosylcobinamide kinase / adenosylcobinamide-phosphate guanylyltransferase [Actinomycetota bacterium]
MKTLVLGGTRSGKSAWAEERVRTEAVTYVATAPPRTGDADWDARIAAHRDRRPAGWDTVETGDDPGALAAVLRSTVDRVLLVDDLGGWLTAAFDAADAWEDPAAVTPRCDDLVSAVAACRTRLVLVSPEVGWGVVPATRSGRVFGDAHGRLNQRLAAACDSVVLVVAGLPLPLKRDGEPLHPAG